MPVEFIGEVVAEGAYAVGEEVGDQVRRRWGWKGCVAVILVVAAIVASLVYFLW